MEWLEFLGAFLGFFLLHNLPTRPGVKATLSARLGTRGFTWLYSLVSLAALYWLLMAAERAPVVILWEWAPWQNHVPLAAMVLVCLILAYGLARPNPFSFGGGNNAAFDPAQPGLIRHLRHPVLAALALWAFAHLVPNGTLAHVLVFTIFGLFAVLGHRLIDRRKQREMENWQSLWQATRAAPLLPRPLSWSGTALRLLLALLAYFTLLHLHGTVLGVYPL